MTLLSARSRMFHSASAILVNRRACSAAIVRAFATELEAWQTHAGLSKADLAGRSAARRN